MTGAVMPIVRVAILADSRLTEMALPAELPLREILPAIQRLVVPAAQNGDSGYLVIPDRRKAIRLAVSLARPGEAVLVAGKGHENYQIWGAERRHFDDREEVAEALRQLD